MPNTSSTPHDHSHHHDGAPATHQHHDAGGTHVMPDGTVMTGEHHDHSAHAHHDHHHAPATAKPAPKGDQG